MIYEYALEPSLLNNWKDFRYFTEKFGVSHGRLISRYPKRWKKLVYESLSSCGEVDRKRIEEGLQRLDGKILVRLHGGWDIQQDWLSNAEAEHHRKPFHAVLASANPRAREFVLEAETLSEEHRLWHVKTSLTVPRTPEQIAACVAPLLQAGNDIVFIDPYFKPQDFQYRLLFEKFFEVALKGRDGMPPTIRVFANEAILSEALFKDECHRKLPEIIPSVVSIRIMRLRQRPGCEELHNRYILTDLGGVKFGNSLREGDSGVTDDVNLLGEDQYQLRWEQYAGPNPVFDLADELVIQGTKPLTR